jgi:chromosome segregation ATPase
MSEIAEIVDNLEDKIHKLFIKLEGLEKSSQDLKLELQKAARIINQQSSEMAALKTQYDALKLANSLLGSAENKRDTKVKINSLIREIDYCIKQLSD